MAQITFDIDKLIELKETYLAALSSIEESLPKVSFNSRNKIIDMFDKTFNIQLKSVKIHELTQHLGRFQEDSEERDVITGIVYYFKIKYSLKNYISYIINSHCKGKILLREYFGELTLNNRRPLPLAPEILACVVDACGVDIIHNNQGEIIELRREL